MSSRRNEPNISHAANLSKEGDFGDELLMSVAKYVPSFSDVLDAIMMQYIHITTEASKCSHLFVSTHTISLHTYHHGMFARLEYETLAGCISKLSTQI